jgi:hypothetical protein
MGDILKYGDRVHIQNGYQNWQGGYLDTCGNSPNGSQWNVSTANSPTRAAGTGTWIITSATGKTIGQEVLSGEIIYLQNLYLGNGGYLDSRGAASPNPLIYAVGTAVVQDSGAPGSSRWRVLAQASSPSDGKVREGDICTLYNEINFANTPGGFLDTYGAALFGNKLGVYTNFYSDRATAGTSFWRFAKA